MRKLAILIIGSFIFTNISAQGLLDIRLAYTPQAYNGSSKGIYEFQAGFNISPRPGTLGLELGILNHFYRSKDFSSRSTIDPINGEPCSFLNSYAAIITADGEIICDSTVMTQNVESRQSYSRLGLYSRINWNGRSGRKLRIIPSLALSVEQVLWDNSLTNIIYEHIDGSITSYGWSKYSGKEEGLNLDVYLLPELRVDYMIVPKWKLRLGMKADFVYSISGDDTRDVQGVLLSGFLSTDLMPID